MINKVNKFLCYLTGWLLTLLGITISNVSCVYGPGYDEEQLFQMRQKEKEVLDLENKIGKIKDEEYKLMRNIKENEYKIKYLEQEKDSLKTLLENFEK
jgi:hypothetical protein